MLMDKIRNAKSVAGINRAITTLVKRRPLNRGMQRIVNERIEALTAAGLISGSRSKKS